MFDPNHIVYNSKRFMIVRTEDTDHYPGASRSISERFDPRRYRIVFRPGTPDRRTLFSGSRYRASTR